MKTVITMTHSFKQLLISNCEQLISVVQFLVRPHLCAFTNNFLSIGVNNLPKVVRQLCPDFRWKLNPRPIDRKSNALLLCHCAIYLEL